jgi:hypothetical protein
MTFVAVTMSASWMMRSAEHPAALLPISKKKTNPRVSDTIQHVFKFGRDPAQVLVEAAFQTVGNDSEKFLYTNEEFAMIQQSVYVAYGIMDDIALWSVSCFSPR